MAGNGGLSCGQFVALLFRCLAPDMAERDDVNAYRRLSQLLALATIALGVAIVVVTLVRSDGGQVGILLGALFIVAGAGRLYLQRGR